MEGKIEGRIEGIREGRIEGKAEGKIEGKIEGKTEVAKNMKSAGLAVQTIMQFTGLTQEQIDQL